MHAFERRLLEATPAWPFSALRACCAAIAGCWFVLHAGHAMHAALACALCATMLIGWLPRLCALLLFVAASTALRQGAAASSLDDYCVALMLFWCALLPVGPKLFELASRDARTARAEGLSRRACLVSVALVYLNVGAWASYPPFESAGRWPPVLLAAVPAFFLLAGRTRLRWLVMAAQIALHLYLLVTTESTFAQLALATTALLVPGELALNEMPVAAPGAPKLPRVEMTSAIAVAYVGIALLVIAAQLLDGQSFMRRSDELLRDVGLPTRYLLLGSSQSADR